MKKIKSQIWIETVIYTLIGLVIIGVLIAIANPQIEKIKDRSVLKQTMDAMDIMDTKISEVEQSAGAVGIVNFKISKGKFLIDGENNNLLYTLEDSRLEFSEVGEVIKEGNLLITTEKHGNRFNVIIKRDYSSLIDIVVAGNSDAKKLLQPGAVSYKIYIENKGQDTVDSLTKIDFKVD
jgi:hypothetical protein